MIQHFLIRMLCQSEVAHAEEFDTGLLPLHAIHDVLVQVMVSQEVKKVRQEAKIMVSALYQFRLSSYLLVHTWFGYSAGGV